MVESIEEDMIVEGGGGSGKSKVGMDGGVEGKKKGSQGIVIFSVGLKRMIGYGMEGVGLDKEGIGQEWGWSDGGFEVRGDVFWEKGNRNRVYVVNDLNVRKFEGREKEKRGYGIDFGDWVDQKFQ